MGQVYSVNERTASVGQDGDAATRRASEEDAYCTSQKCDVVLGACSVRDTLHSGDWDSTDAKRRANGSGRAETGRCSAGWSQIDRIGLKGRLKSRRHGKKKT